MLRSFFLLAAVSLLIGCVKSIDHDEVAAGKRAVEFAQVALVKQDFERGYALLSDSAKRYVPLDKFKETVLRLHPKTFPVSVTVTQHEPMPGETAIYIYMVGENSGERFYYTLTMEGTATSGYRVSRLNRGAEPLSPSKDRQKFGKNLEHTGCCRHA